jgi:predicted metal-binding membrane protein
MTRMRAAVLGWGLFYGGVLAAWVALWGMAQARSALAGDWGLALLADLCRTDAAGAGFGGLFAMWAVMSVAMMAPTAVPAFRTWATLPGGASGGAVGTLALGLGYLMVWLGASGGFALAQQALGARGWLAPDGASLSSWLTAALFALAGVYQFSRFKAACLSRCRLPLTFFLERWRPGPVAAARSGVDLGLVCLGCCWALMALAFVGGMSSLLWMGLATVLMVVEKLPDIGRHVTRPLGWALLAGAIAFAAKGVLA